MGGGKDRRRQTVLHDRVKMRVVGHAENQDRLLHAGFPQPHAFFAERNAEHGYVRVRVKMRSDLGKTVPVGVRLDDGKELRAGLQPAKRQSDVPIHRGGRNDGVCTAQHTVPPIQKSHTV